MSAVVSPERVRFDREIRAKQGIRRLAGLDEVGRGALAGPVIVGCVMFRNLEAVGVENQDLLLEIDDSKRLRPRHRERLARAIRAHADCGIGRAGSEEIDAIGIVAATRLAARRAVRVLLIRPELLLTDRGLKVDLGIEERELVGGDYRSLSVAAASILAKVDRDGWMRWIGRRYRSYGFARNKGYGTAEHRAAITVYGLSPLHRRSFCRVNVA
ncbi:MAG: ribonuclease HII [Candidatus Bipolaricaulia bacterium]